ncbi:MAG: thiol peroxidase [Brevinemataceae bacterium]
MEITFKGTALTVPGEQLKIGDKAPDFHAVGMDLTPWTLSQVKGTKIISVVPSLDTGVCQIQTKKFNQEASSLHNVHIITISLDLPFAQSRWCGAENINNLTVVSDYQEREFGNKYHLLISELKLLTRAVLILDENNIVKYTEYLKEITHEPNYTAALEALQ